MPSNTRSPVFRSLPRPRPIVVATASSRPLDSLLALSLQRSHRIGTYTSTYFSAHREGTVFTQPHRAIIPPPSNSTSTAKPPKRRNLLGTVSSPPAVTRALETAQPTSNADSSTPPVLTRPGSLRHRISGSDSRFTPPSSRAPLNIAPSTLSSATISTPAPLSLNPLLPPPTSVTVPPPLPSTTMSTAITKGIQGMPAPTWSKAPSFDGETSDLLEFFEIFDDLAKYCDLSDAEKCKTVVRYVDKTTKFFWVRLKGYESQDYTEFKKSIFYQYPGADRGVRYTIRDLERVVAAPTNDDITTESELVYYYHHFYAIAVWLVENKKISEDQRNRYFWKGLPPALRRRIELRLEHKKADYSRDEATDFHEVVEAGRFVLSDRAFDVDRDDMISARIKAIRAERSTTITDKPTRRSTRTPPALLASDDEDDGDRDNRRKDAPHGVRTKRENYSNALPKSHMDEVEELSRKLHTLDISDVTYLALFSRLALAVSLNSISSYYDAQNQSL